MTVQRRAALFLALLGVALTALWLRRSRETSPEAVRLPADPLGALQAIEEQEARKYWQPEIAAQAHGLVIDQLWDALNASTNKLLSAGAFPVGEMALAAYPRETLLPHGIHVLPPGPAKPSLARHGWQALLEKAAADGWRLGQCEFRHNAFRTAAGSRPAESTFYFSAHLENPQILQRAVLEGDLLIRWTGPPGAPAAGSVDATRIELRTRQGPPPFREILRETIRPPDGSYFIDPLIVWDLDQDGASEIILAAANRVYRRNASGGWSHSPLAEQDPGLIFTAILGDFSGDEVLDLLTARFDGLFLHEGSPGGRFSAPPRLVWAAQPRLRYAQTAALGDVDGDGDLDLFLGQYKVPYDQGQMPRPYFDANDGHPWFLLQNDGRGNFTDITQTAGLGAKRGRRVYHATLIDLDRDGRLDLVTVSDFAGVDAFRNEGGGRFKDVTAVWFPERHGLGMAGAFADFNHDGHLDFLMIGMNSPVADRLAAAGLDRPYDLPDAGMRARVTRGNRLYFGGPGGVFREAPASRVVARTGWSWGCAADDFDQDGWPDLYVANGHESRASVREYEPEFWLHDIYVGESRENTLAQAYFREKMGRTRGRGWSYGGYEKNRFFLNLGGTNFLECGYLFGLALEEDSRNVIAEDLDQDGRPDLLVTTFEVHPDVRQTLRVYRNELPAEPRYRSVPVPRLSQSGQVVSTGPGRVHAILSSGSYRSQIEPKLRLLPGEQPPPSPGRP